MTYFRYTPEIVARFPNIVGGVLFASGLHNAPSSPDLLAYYQAEQAQVIARIGDTPLSELPSLAAWRSAFRAFGVDPTQYRSATEALLRRLTKQGDIPSINTLVDIGNLISIRYGLPVAILDTQVLHRGITVRLAQGTEQFFNLGSTDPEHPAAGEVIFIDEREAVYARRWCWRQSHQSAAQESTTAAIITIEAHHTDARADVERAVSDVTTLLQKYAGGTLHSVLLNAEVIHGAF
jgi:DNA/RNA-binding domain of Phe-tRNA-synthetase-like protein